MAARDDSNADLVEKDDYYAWLGIGKTVRPQFLYHFE